MESYKEFYKALEYGKLISPIYYYVLEMLEKELIEKDDKDKYLELFAIYFSLIEAGNITMSLDKTILKGKWFNMVDEADVLVSEQNDYDSSVFESLKDESNYIINNFLDRMNKLTNIIGNISKLFVIDNNYLYAKKYYVARKGIIKKINELFKYHNSFNDFNYKDWLEDNSSFELSLKQEEAVVKGVNNNLIITGGPGTGKTTSILYLLIALLSKNTNYSIHLIAPSGKASSRMKESILGGLSNISEKKKEEYKEVFSIIENLEESTIHRLLGMNFETNGFSYNKYHMFKTNSIFIVDEASMIDACLFNSLLEAIPSGAKIYIMGDKDQLPSVECGSVFADLVSNIKLEDNVVRLDESRRFGQETNIYKLAKKINEGLNLDLSNSDFKDPNEFDIYDVDKKTCPIFYYQMPEENQKDVINSILSKWGNHFYKNGKSLQEKATNIDCNDIEYLHNLYNETEEARILAAENEGIRGVKTLNNQIKNIVIDKSIKTSTVNHYAGEPMMINKNNKLLDLYNGDSGILVTFKEDPTLYFMVKKSTVLVSKDEKLEDKIFKLSDFVFYPLRLIASNEIDLAYAITIHKSQGSDYKSILVILPTKEGHPLLNRQIVYTAITRTKGNTYILSSVDRLNEAKDRVSFRDTNIDL